MNAMHDWMALRQLVVLLVLTGVILFVFGWMFSEGESAYFAPCPGSAAQQLVKALQAHRYGGARATLAEDAKKVWTEEALRALVRSLEHAGREIEDVHGEEERYPEPDTATATAAVKFSDKSERLLTFPCVREHGEWRVSSLGSLEGVGKVEQQAVR